MIVLSSCREEQAVGTRQASNRLVLTVKRFSELEVITITFEPHGLSSMRPRKQPLLFDSRGAQLKPVTVSNTFDDEIDFDDSRHETG